jgi:hypothetical protein
MSKKKEQEPDLISLLEEAKATIEGGLESPGLMEPEWSVKDRMLVDRLALVIEGLKARGER